MEHFFKKLKRAWYAFKTEPTRVEKVPSFEDLIKIFNDFGKNKTPEQIYQMKMEASAVAKEAHLKQNTMIDLYVEKILRRTLGDLLFDIYITQKKPVPFLETRINMFMDQNFESFGRQITLFIKGNKVGDALFRANIKDGIVTYDVVEYIK